MSLKSKIANLWAKITAFVKNIYNRVDDVADKFCPVAIKAVEFLKYYNGSAAGDAVAAIISFVIPGDADDKLIKEIRKRMDKALPVVLMHLKMIHAIADIEDPNEQLKAICKAIQFSPDEAKNAICHTFATLLLEALADGKLTWGESVMLAEHYYQTYKK